MDEMYTTLLEKCRFLREKGTELAKTRSEFDADEAYQLILRSDRVMYNAPIKDFEIIESIFYQQFLLGYNLIKNT